MRSTGSRSRLSWPERVTREWALDGSTGEGVQRLHPRLGRRSRATRLVGELESAVAISIGDERRDRRRRGHGGRRLAVTARRAPASSARWRPERSISSVRVLGVELHGQRRSAPGRPPLCRRAGLRRHQHEPLDDEEAVRERPARARRQRVLQAHGARRVGAQHAGRELPVALLVGHLRRQPRGGRPARRTSTNPNPPVEFFGRGVDVEVAVARAARRSRAPATASRRRTSPAICALILAKHPELTPFQLKSVLYLTANERGVAHDR